MLVALAVSDQHHLEVVGMNQGVEAEACTGVLIDDVTHEYNDNQNLPPNRCSHLPASNARLASLKRRWYRVPGFLCTLGYIGRHIEKISCSAESLLECASRLLVWTFLLAIQCLLYVPQPWPASNV